METQHAAVPFLMEWLNSGSHCLLIAENKLLFSPLIILYILTFNLDPFPHPFTVLHHSPTPCAIHQPSTPFVHLLTLLSLPAS